MRNKLFIFVLLITYSLHGQDIQRYHQLINRAELAIINQDINQAFIKYDSAFRYNQHPFSQDIYNKLICSITLQKKKKSKKLLLELAKKNLNLSIIDTNQIIKEFKGKINWNSFKKKYSKVQKQSFTLAKQTLKTTMDSLFERDQFFRKQDKDYRLTLKDSVRHVDEGNSTVLINIIDKLGYPSEELTGVNNSKDFFRQPFEYVIWHQTTLNLIHSYENILRDASIKGLIDPQRAAELIENHIGNEIFSCNVFYKVACDSNCTEETLKKIKGKIFSYNIKPSYLKKIDERRLQINLEPLADYTKKILFAKKITPFKLRNSSISTFSFITEADLLTFIENMVSSDE